MFKCMGKCKNRYFYHIFVSLSRHPCGNNVKCDMDGKRIGTDGHRVTAPYVYTCRARRVSDSYVYW